MFLLLTLGCSFGLSTNDAKDTERATAPRIDSVTPAVGPVNGGTEVTIAGAGFTGEVTVTFGGVLGEATVVDAKTLTAITPDLGIEQVVDVKVTTDDGSDTLEDGFAYRRRRPDSGGGGGDDTGVNSDTDDTDVSYAGMVGGYGVLELVDHACPTCFGLDWGAAPTGTASTVFHAPTDGSWLSWLPAEGACLSGVSPNTLAGTTLDAGSVVVFSDGAQDLTLTGTTLSSGIAYLASGLSTDTYSAGSTWTVAAAGGADVSSLMLGNALRSPADFTSIEPTTLLTESSPSAFTTVFGSGSGTAISWAPAGEGDFVLFVLEASYASEQLGTTTCRSPDDGSFVIPASAANDWPRGSRLAVRIQRYVVTETVLPNGATFEGIGRIERIATGTVSY